jgi:hypothetical protein
MTDQLRYGKLTTTDRDDATCDESLHAGPTRPTQLTMARYGPNGRVRDRPQRPLERLMPRAERNAFQLRRQARWDRGQATDEDTVDSGDNEEEEGEAEGGDEEVENPPPEEPIDLQAQESAVAMFRCTLLLLDKLAYES